MELNEKSVSKKQQRFFGMVHAAKKGKMDDTSPEVKKVADSISDDDAEEFASTKHKDLPEKKEKEDKKDEHSLWQTWKENRIMNESCKCECECKNCKNCNCSCCDDCSCNCGKEE